MHEEFKFHPQCKTMQITHLCFADDIILFASGNVRSVEIIHQYFTRFSKASSLVISKDKSEIIFGGVSKVVSNQIVKVTGFKTGTLSMKYPGIPLSRNKLTKNECQQLVEKITSRIRVWMRKRLSYAGIIRLINSVLLNMHIY